MAGMTTATARNALVVYASTHGHTAKIAARIAGAMREQGGDVDLRDVADASAAMLSAYLPAALDVPVRSADSMPAPLSFRADPTIVSARAAFGL